MAINHAHRATATLRPTETLLNQVQWVTACGVDGSTQCVLNTPPSIEWDDDDRAISPIPHSTAVVRPFRAISKKKVIQGRVILKFIRSHA